MAPEHRRKGLATAMCRHVETATAALGGTEVFIDTWHMDDYPAPAATYLSGRLRVQRSRLYPPQNCRAPDP